MEERGRRRVPAEPGVRDTDTGRQRTLLALDVDPVVTDDDSVPVCADLELQAVSSGGVPFGHRPGLGGAEVTNQRHGCGPDSQACRKRTGLPDHGRETGTHAEDDEDLEKRYSAGPAV